MLSENVKNRLSEAWPQKNKSIARLVYKLYRYFVVWQVKKMQSENKSLNAIKPGYIHLLAGIGLSGSTNKDLAQKAMVTKQAMSKLINEMLSERIVELEKNDNDGRSNKVSLTDAGAEMLIAIFENNEQLIEKFEAHIGQKKTKLLLDLMSELVDSLMSNENQNDVKKNLESF